MLKVGNKRIVVDNGHSYIEGNLIALCDHLTSTEGFLIEGKNNYVYFFPSAHAVRYWFKGRWIYVNKTA